VPDDHILATFTRRDEAVTAVQAAARAFPDAEVRLGDADDALDALALGQRAEMEDSMPAISVGVMSGPMARGALLWGLVGLVVGAVLTWPVSLVVTAGGLPRWQLAIFMAMAGALALSSATFVLGAARQAVKEGETVPEDPTAVVRMASRPEQAEDRLRFFVEAGARSARFVDAPVARPPTDTVEAPRPAPVDPTANHGEGSDHDAGFRSDVG
jgi:hypothetical protein